VGVKVGDEVGVGISGVAVAVSRDETAVGVVEIVAV